MYDRTLALRFKCSALVQTLLPALQAFPAGVQPGHRAKGKWTNRTRASARPASHRAGLHSSQMAISQFQFLTKKCYPQWVWFSIIGIPCVLIVLTLNAPSPVGVAGSTAAAGSGRWGTSSAGDQMVSPCHPPGSPSSLPCAQENTNIGEDQLQMAHWFNSKLWTLIILMNSANV